MLEIPEIGVLQPGRYYEQEVIGQVAVSVDSKISLSQTVGMVDLMVVLYGILNPLSSFSSTPGLSYKAVMHLLVWTIFIG